MSDTDAPLVPKSGGESAKIQTLNLKLQDAEEHRNQLQSQNKQLQQEIDDWKKTIPQLREEVKKEKDEHDWTKILLEEEIEKVQIAVTALRKLQMQRKEWDKTNMDLEHCRRVIKEQENRIEELEEDIKKEKKEHEKTKMLLREQEHILNTETSARDALIQAVTERMKDVQEQSDKIKKIYDELNTKGPKSIGEENTTSDASVLSGEGHFNLLFTNFHVREIAKSLQAELGTGDTAKKSVASLFEEQDKLDNLVHVYRTERLAGDCLRSQLKNERENNEQLMDIISKLQEQLMDYQEGNVKNYNLTFLDVGVPVEEIILKSKKSENVQTPFVPKEVM